MSNDILNNIITLTSRDKKPKTAVSAVMQNVSSAITATGNINSYKKLSDKLGLESYETGDVPLDVGEAVAGIRNINESIDRASDELRAAVDNNDRLKGLVNNGSNNDDEIGIDFTDTQRKAALAVAVTASNPREYMQNEYGRQPVTSSPSPNSEVVDTGVLPNSTTGVTRQFTGSLESYDTSSTVNTMTTSIAYNLFASRQDEFGETLFPTIICSPDTATLTVSVRLMMVIQDAERSLSKLHRNFFNAKNLTKGLINSDILADERTRCYPVYSDTNPINNQYLVDPSLVAPKEVKLYKSGVTQKTSPLKVGANIPDYIALSTPSTLLTKGVMDQTDQLDSSIKLSTVYIKLENEVFSFSGLDMLPEANYTYQPSGDSRNMMLNFNSSNFAFNKNTLTHTGAESTVLRDIRNSNLNVNILVNISSTVNLNSAAFASSSSDIVVLSVYDAAKDLLSLESGTGKDVVDLFKNAEVIGIDIISRRVNTNRRDKGLLIDTNIQNLIYNIPLLSPITAQTAPISSGADNADQLSALIKTTHIRASNAAVDTLLGAESLLRSMPKVYDKTELYSNSAVGGGKFYVDSFFEEKEIDLLGDTSNIKSSEKMADIQATIINVIRDMAVRAYTESGYLAAMSTYYGQPDAKPLIVVATDPQIANYILTPGDWRTLGNGFDVKVVSTPNEKMRGKINIVFGKSQASTLNSNEQVDPLVFGNMAYRPELVIDLLINRDGQTSKELAVQPSFLHFINCPIMCSIVVKNLSQAIRESLPVNVKEVTKALPAPVTPEN